MSLGALPSQYLRELFKKNYIVNSSEESSGQNQPTLQPSSLDLTISDEIYRMKGIVLPKKGETIREIINFGSLFRTDLEKPLECNGVYLIRLNEKLNLPKNIYAYCNNKSTSGRINLQARLLVDGVPQFDMVPRSYQGELWLLISPKSFAVKLYPKNSLNQMRFLNSDTRLNQLQTQILHEECPLLYNKNGEIIPASDIYFDPLGGLTMSINLDQDIVGYKCSPSGAKVIDFNKFDHDPEEFFETMPRPRNGHIVLSRDSFYILSTIEYIRVPLNYAVEMIAYDTSKGEFRSHYAGFFDPGWGYGSNGERSGSPAVLEVITYDNDFILRHGQPICKMVYERLAEQADISYGSGKTKSNYHEQTGPKLSKHFRDYGKTTS